MDTTLLAHRLKTLRKEHGLTQQELGNYLNISRQGYSHYENGTRVPDFHVLERLADLYGLTINSLLSLSEPSRPSLTNTVEEEPASAALAGLTRKEQMILNLFTQLSPEDKDDFEDLVAVKLHQHKIRQAKKER